MINFQQFHIHHRIQVNYLDTCLNEIDSHSCSVPDRDLRCKIKIIYGGMWEL